MLPATCVGTLARGQAPAPPEVRRLNGVVHQNGTWSGTIIITDDLLIDGATITVAPGTVIEFADARSGHHPTLTVGSPTEFGGHLDIKATTDQPVTFRTRRGTNPGRIVVNIRPRAVLSQSPVRITDSAPASAREPCDVSWQHVVLEDLGHPLSSGPVSTAEGRHASAIMFVAKGAAHTLGISKCTFKNTTRLRLDVADGAQVTLLENVFSRPKERLCIETESVRDETTASPIRILRQRLPGVIRTHNAAADISDCILIGEHAAMVIEGDASAAVRIAGNYIHNTAGSADGHYCLNCQNADAFIQGNILHGGTTCVYAGSRHMSGNILIAARRLLKPGTSNEISRTVSLVRSLPTGSVFERNLLLGPALSLLCPQPLISRGSATPGEAKPTLLRHNVFDGFSRTPRALHLNTTGVTRVPLEVWNNVFLRVRVPVFDEASDAEPLAYADYNAVAPPPRMAPSLDRFPDASDSDASPLRVSEIGRCPHDIQGNNVAALLLRAVPAAPPTDFDEDLRSGRASVSELRDRLFDTYSTTGASPLFGKGRGSSSSDIKEDKHTSIGF